jgi:6-pyruvoyltetrahydropterin/6-carboxytetrahydropterin synthase
VSGTYTLSVEKKLSVSHILADCSPCDRLHGHTWRVRAEWVFSGLDGAGMGVDFRVLKDVLGQEVGERFDHQHLNDVSPFDKLQPTAENFAKEIYSLLRRSFDPGPAGRLKRVEVWEGPEAFAAYEE